MHFADRNNLGWLVLRHHDPRVDADLRNVPGALLQTGHDDNDKPAVEAPGDLCGGAVWRANDGQRFDMSAWFLTGAPVWSNTTDGTTTDKGWSLIRNADERDERLESKDLATPEWFEGTFPKSHWGSAAAAVEEGEQIDLALPAFWGLYAPQEHGPSSAGTFVYDLDDENKPDKDRAAQLQQFWRVADLGNGLCGFGGKTLAIQLGPESRDAKPGGAWFAEGKNYAAGTARAGGPFVGGAGFCQHQQAGPDGALTPLHLATGALFLGLERDGPLHFEPDPVDWVGMRDEGLASRVHLSWEQNLGHVAGCQGGSGRWVWWTRQTSFVGDPDPKRQRKQYALIDYSKKITGGDPGDPGGTGVVLDPFTQGGAGITDFGLGLLDKGCICPDDETQNQVVISGAGKPVYATSPYMQAAPGFMFKAQDPTAGATLAADDHCCWFHNSPNVAQIVSFGSQTNGEFATASGTAQSHTVGQGGFAILPPDVDPYAVFRGESTSSNYTVQFTVPTGLAQLAFGDVGTGGLTGTGMVIETGTGGRLDIKTVDATGAVTATAYIPSGASGDISGAAGSGDVTGPAGATAGNLPQLDATGKVISDSGIAASSVLTGSLGAADNALVRTDGTGGTTGQGSGILVDDSDNMTSVGGLGLSNQTGDPFGGAATGLFVDNTNSTARPSWVISGTEYSIPFVSLSGIGDGDVPAWNAAGNTWTSSAPSSLPSSAGAYAIIRRNSGDTAWESDTQVDARHDPNSTSWANPGHFFQNTDNQSTRDLPVLELAVPNHTNGGNGNGGAGLAFTGQTGTPTGGLSGRRTGTLSGDLYAGGTTGGVPDYTARFWTNYSSTAGMNVEGDGMLGFNDTITGTDPNPFSSYPKFYSKDGSLWGRNAGGDPFPVGPTAGEAITGLADDGVHEFGEGYVTYEQTLPTSGSAAVTISNIIRAPSLVDDVSVVIKTAIPTTGGITSIQVGDGTTAARFGTFTTFAKNDQTTWEDWATETPPIANTTSGATDIVLTPAGGTWDAPAGVVVVAVRSGFVTLGSY